MINSGLDKHTDTFTVKIHFETLHGKLTKDQINHICIFLMQTHVENQVLIKADVVKPKCCYPNKLHS